MNYHIVLTRRCNLNCIYCHGGEETENTEIQYSLDELESFLLKDRTQTVMLFYGGEPTLRISLMTEMMNRFRNARFMLQTNGLLLNRIPEEYVHQIHSILVSIDGRESVTDGYRSDGVYKKVLENARWLEQIGYEGDIVARMAVSQETDIYQDVRHLLDMRDPTFKHVHWQLNVVWDAQGNWTDFDGWVEQSYNPGISRLVQEWVSKINEGVVEGVVPFLPLMHTLLTDQPARLWCGSGLDTFAIHVDGSIGICPISPDWEFSIVGNIRDTHPNDLRDVMLVDEPCPSCSEFSVCGGRCLFTNKQRLWGQEGFEKVCQTVKWLIKCLRDIVPHLQELINKGNLSLNDFQYPEYNNGCEIIP